MKEAAISVSPRGQITLPANVRKRAGIKTGDALSVTVEGDKVILRPVDIVQLERYTPERLVEFEEAAKMTPEQIRQIRSSWGL